MVYKTIRIPTNVGMSRIHQSLQGVYKTILIPTIVGFFWCHVRVTVVYKTIIIPTIVGTDDQIQSIITSL